MVTKKLATERYRNNDGQSMFLMRLEFMLYFVQTFYMYLKSHELTFIILLIRK